MVAIASYGGGVNSTAMLIGLYERGEVCDLILFADTGGEKPETYVFRDVFSEWLQAHGFPEIVTVREERWTLEEDCRNRNSLPSIVIGMRSCSDKFKIRPQNRFTAKWPPAIEAWAKGQSITKLIGFDAGEPHRVRDFSTKKYKYRFPLIEWDWAREECVDAIRRHGLAVPPKSSCFFCPEMKEKEILELKEKHPELLARALEMEANNTDVWSVRGLARKHSWKDILAFYDAQGTLPIFQPQESRLPCVCVDGEP